MAPRTLLHEILVGALGSNHVYFQPPASFQMVYPCVVYSRDRKDEKFADDRLYNHTMCYRLMIIDRDPDSSIPDRVAELPFCSFVTHYKVDQLNHDIYNLYF